MSGIAMNSKTTTSLLPESHLFEKKDVIHAFDYHNISNNVALTGSCYVHRPVCNTLFICDAERFSLLERCRMHMYKHALLLVQNEIDGVLLLHHAERLAKEMGTQITLGHISSDYRELDYTSDALTRDRQSHEVIEAKAMLSRLAESSSIHVQVKSIISIQRFKDVEAVIQHEDIDLVMLGHKNRLFGVFSSFSFEFINHLSVDVLIKHISTP